MKTGCRIHEEGFTLIEVMIALVIFSVGILGIGQMQISAIQGNDSAHEFHEALTAAQNKIDTLKLLPYTDPLLSDSDGDGTGQDADDDGIDDGGNEFGLDDTAGAADQSETVDGKYNLFWNIAVDEPVVNEKKIRMIVQWQDNSISRQMELDAAIISG